MRKTRVAIIIDNNTLAHWQKASLEYSANVIDIKLVLNCTNTVNKRHYSKNLLYYALNFLTLKNQQTRRVPIGDLGAETKDFKSRHRGAWHSIPSDIAELIASTNIDVVIKFGMSLLRIDTDMSKFTILSFHHGNPEKYRGRPAGFYELLNYDDKIGIIVQRLSNTLDAGDVYAYGESKIVHHSYKASAMNFYFISRYLLKKAIFNIHNGTLIPLSKDGKLCRLPSNIEVINFLIKLVSRKFKRMIYGAFIEKRWKIATLPWKQIPEKNYVIPRSDLSTIPVDSRYTFYADPFFSVGGSCIRAEALSARTGVGDIIEIPRSDTRSIKILLSGKHYSYPFSLAFSAMEHLIPEVATHSSPYYINLEEGHKEKILIKGLERERFVDLTLVEHEGTIYLFCGEYRTSLNVLFLYYADSLDSEFVNHPQNPIKIDPSGARMGGRITLQEGRLVRFGQDNCYRYGSGLNKYRINVLSRTAYHEELVGFIEIAGVGGPHTIDFNENDAVIDFYEEKVSLLAGYRRALSAVK